MATPCSRSQPERSGSASIRSPSSQPRRSRKRSARGTPRAGNARISRGSESAPQDRSGLNVTALSAAWPGLACCRAVPRESGPGGGCRTQRSRSHGSRRLSTLPHPARRRFESCRTCPLFAPPQPWPRQKNVPGSVARIGSSAGLAWRGEFVLGHHREQPVAWRLDHTALLRPTAISGQGACDARQGLIPFDRARRTNQPWLAWRGTLHV